MRATFAAERSGLTGEAWPNCDVPCFLGRVLLPDDVTVAPERTSRNNRLIELALRQDKFAAAVEAATRCYDPARCGLVMGTSTSSIDRTEEAYASLGVDGRFAEAYQQPATHNPHAPGDFVAQRLGLAGPRLTVSAACASSAKVFATAKRWLNQGLVDAVVVGGADTLCLSVIYGFHSLQLIAQEPCRPFSADGKGISLGEAAGFALLTKDAAGVGIELLGVGESCDAHHMSSAHPEGLGAKLSMQRALQDAELRMTEIDYVNLHGTGTRGNDATEGRVCGELLPAGTIASATKGWTGHTLGAAGIVEATICMEALTRSFVPGTLNTLTADAPFELMLASSQTSVTTALTNSFGFGGNNCSVIFGRA
jgi:3-oxoacyl-[acyl-carrier-protein] synthase-1